MATTKRPSTPSPKPEPDAKQPKRGPGRPPGDGYHPTDEQRTLVVVMSAMGIPEDQMVLAIINPATNKPISPVTLRKHFREEIDKGFIQANSKVAASLFKNATTPTDAFPGGIPSAQIFWAKTRLRWQQRPELNPLPPPPAAESADERDTARRLAFMLAKGASQTERLEKPKPPPAKKKVSTPA